MQDLCCLLLRELTKIKTISGHLGLAATLSALFLGRDILVSLAQP